MSDRYQKDAEKVSQLTPEQYRVTQGRHRASL